MDGSTGGTVYKFNSDCFYFSQQNGKQIHQMKKDRERCVEGEQNREVQHGHLTKKVNKMDIWYDC